MHRTIRPHSKPSAESKLRGDSERRTGVDKQVHEDSSTESTKQVASVDGFGKRSIKSFVLRAGKMTTRQHHGLHHLLADYLLANSVEIWDFASIFANSKPVIVEIGFGMGASLLEMAKKRPEYNFIGIEVHLAGLGSLAADLADEQLTNVRLANFDAIQAFQQNIADASLAGVQIFFPDPWQKKKHHKRRLIQSEFVKLLASKIKPGGILHCATDWENYAEHILEVLNSEKSLRNLSLTDSYIDRPDSRPMTKFERRGVKLGHKVWDLQFVRV